MRNSAVTFTGKDQVRIQDAPLPSAGPNNVIVKTTCSLVSTGTETICLQRKFSEGTNWHGWVTYPFYPGYCAVGRVDPMNRAPGYEVGERVMVWGQHQQYSSNSRVCRVPQGVSDEEAAWLPMAVIAQHGFRHAKMEMGESAVVVGLGMLGQLVVQYCQLAGAKHIIAIDPAQRRLDWAMQHGATHALAMPVQDTVAEVTRITGGEMADVVFDMTGFAPVFAASHPLLRDFGRIILIGDTGTPEQQHMTSLFMGRNLTVIGAHQSRAAKRPYWDHTRQGELFLAFIQRGWMSVKDLITHRYPFEQAPEAYRMLIERRDDAMGVIFTYDTPPA